MSSIFDGNIKVSIFGESHGEMIGAVIDNVPAGRQVDVLAIMDQMKRRTARIDAISTTRHEKDVPKIVSGILNGYTTGAPVCVLIENVDIKSRDYDEIHDILRPGHADFTAFVKYCGFNDTRGAGHLSGRLTAVLTFCGAFFRQILERAKVCIGAHIQSIYDVNDEPFDSTVSKNLLDKLAGEQVPVIDESVREKMIDRITWAKQNGDSVGGVIECAIINVPAGLGDPLFDGIENRIASLMFAVPAVKGIEFGSGFAGSRALGSENNDEFVLKNDKICTVTNNHGGILGGISSGMPIVFRCAVKPTPSIEKLQNTINVKTRQNVKLSVHGRHDPCIVPRAVPVIESVAAIAMADFFRGANLL